MEQVVKNSCLVDYITDFIARLVIITYFTNILSDEHVNENLIHVVIYVFNCAIYCGYFITHGLNK